MHTTTQERIIRPARNILGSLRLPGDKSISHRYAMLAGFAEGTSRFSNFSTGADCASTLACMQALGAKVSKLEQDAVEITGVGGRVTPSSQPLDCGNSGSTMRMIRACSPRKRAASRSSATPRSRADPWSAFASRSTRWVRISRSPTAMRPWSIRGSSAPRHRLHNANPQRPGKNIDSLAGLQTYGATTVAKHPNARPWRTSPSCIRRDRSREPLDSVSITGQQRLTAIDAAVPGDMSSAAFFLLRRDLFPGASLVLDELDSTHPRRLLDVLTTLGAQHRGPQPRRKEHRTGRHRASHPPADGLRQLQFPAHWLRS